MEENMETFDVYRYFLFNLKKIQNVKWLIFF